MAHPAPRSPTRTSTASTNRSRSPTPRKSAAAATNPTATTRKSRASRSPVPSTRNISPRRGLSPMRHLGGSFRGALRRSDSIKAVATTTALEQATAADPMDNNTFLKYCQVHGHEVTEENRNSLPLNRLSVASSRTSTSSAASSSVISHGMDGSDNTTMGEKTVGLAAHLEYKLHSAADHAAEWLDSWKQPQQVDSQMSYFFDHHPLGPHAKKLQYSQHDILNVAMDDKTFHSLKDGLRKRGVITNNYLRENLHFYVQHIKNVNQRKEERRRHASRSPMGRNAAA